MLLSVYVHNDSNECACAHKLIEQLCLRMAHAFTPAFVIRLYGVVLLWLLLLIHFSLWCDVAMCPKRIYFNFCSKQNTANKTNRWMENVTADYVMCLWSLPGTANAFEGCEFKWKNVEKNAFDRNVTAYELSISKWFEKMTWAMNKIQKKYGSVFQVIFRSKCARNHRSLCSVTLKSQCEWNRDSVRARLRLSTDWAEYHVLHHLSSVIPLSFAFLSI